MLKATNPYKNFGYWVLC